MLIKGFSTRLISSSKQGNIPHGNVTATGILDRCSPPQQRVNHKPCRKERQNSPKESFRSVLFRILPKAVASRTKRTVRRAKSFLSCLIPQRSMEVDVPAQLGIPKVDKSSPVFEDSAGSATNEEIEIMLEDLSPSFGSYREDEKAGEESGVECELVQQEPSTKESKEDLILKREKPYRYHHRLPCEEKRPSVEKGTVSRLSLMFEYSPTNGLSPEKFITQIPSAAVYDVTEDFAGKKGEPKDGNFDNAPARLTKTSHSVPREMLEGTASSASAEHEEESHTEAVSGDADQKSDVHMLKSSRVAPQKALQNLSSFEMPLGNGICSSASSVDSVGTTINMPLDDDVIEGVENELLEDRWKEDKSNMRSSHVVTFHETASLAEKVRNDDREDADMTTRQVSFRSDEDYCTPILEFELKDIGCGLQ